MYFQSQITTSAQCEQQTVPVQEYPQQQQTFNHVRNNVPLSSVATDPGNITNKII